MIHLVVLGIACTYASIALSYKYTSIFDRSLSKLWLTNDGHERTGNSEKTAQ